MTGTAPRWRIEHGSLLRDGEPVLLLGGQVHNSTSSDSSSIAASFRHARDFGANAILAPATWESAEPVEGEYDFTLVDSMLDEAERYDLALVLLWFGAFKNAGSSYAPRWVRADVERFPRARVDGRIRQVFTYDGATARPVLSVFSDALREADAKALEAVVTHVASHPFRDRLAMVQVENEVGILADSRDRSSTAQSAWEASVPLGFMTFISEAPTESLTGRLWREGGRQTKGTWADVLGDAPDAEEIFMAWGFARYVGELAERASAIWPVPFYANAWLGPQPGQPEPGQYPSGGPGARVLDVWRATAPALAMLSPDIYIDDAASVMSTYAFPGNPLFVPECRLRAGDVVLALARGALGWAAFGIDDARIDGQTSRLFASVAPVADQLIGAHRAGRIAGVVIESGVQEARDSLGGYELVARGTRVLFERMLLDVGVAHLPPVADQPLETIDGARITVPHDVRPYALVIAEPDDTFLVIGQGVTLDFFRQGERVEIDSVVEIRLVAGVCQDGRVLNGDERLNLLPDDRPGVVRIRLLRVPADR